MRIKRGQIKRKKHKKCLKEAKGYAHAKSHRYRNAKNQLEKSLQYATRDRKRKKRLMRRMWITRVNIACKANGVSYSRFISGLKKSGVVLNRKMLHDIALSDIDTIRELVSISQSAN